MFRRASYQFSNPYANFNAQNHFDPTRFRGVKPPTTGTKKDSEERIKNENENSVL